MKKFYLHRNVEILLYLARAHFVYGKLKETRRILLHARHIAPQVRRLTSIQIQNEIETTERQLRD